MMDPPPYTPYPTVNAALDPDSTEKALRLYQFLLENIAYSFGVSQQALLDALTSEPLHLRFTGMTPFVISRTTEQERERYLPLCKLLHTTQALVRHNRHSLITQEDYLYLYHNLILPCDILDLAPAWTCSWIASYRDHQFDPEKRFAAYPYSNNFWRLNIFCHTFLFAWNHEWLTHDLTAADVFVDSFSPNEKTRMLLGSAIARFGDKYQGYRGIPSSERGMWANRDMLELVKAIRTYTAT